MGQSRCGWVPDSFRRPQGSEMLKRLDYVKSGLHVKSYYSPPPPPQPSNQLRGF